MKVTITVTDNAHLPDYDLDRWEARSDHPAAHTTSQSRAMAVMGCRGAVLRALGGWGNPPEQVAFIETVRAGMTEGNMSYLRAIHNAGPHGFQPIGVSMPTSCSDTWRAASCNPDSTPREIATCCIDSIGELRSSREEAEGELAVALGRVADLAAGVRELGRCRACSGRGMQAYPDTCGCCFTDARCVACDGTGLTEPARRLLEKYGLC